MATGAAAAILAACAAPAPTATPAPAKPAAPPAAAPPVAAATNTPAPVAKPAEPVKPVEKPAAKPAAPAAAAAPPKGAVGGTVVWDTFRGVGTPWPEDRIKAFEAANAGWKVEFRPIPLPGGVQAEAYPKMYAMFASGTLGDVFAFDPSHWEFYRAVPKGLLKPIDDYVRDDKYDLGQFYAPFIEMQKWQGKLWGLPSWGWSGQDGWIYNQVHFDEAGIKAPDHNSTEWTPDAMREQAKKLTKMGQGGAYDRFGVNLALGAAGATVYVRAYNQPDFHDGKKSSITDPGVIKGFKWVQDMAQTDKSVALPGAFQGSAVDLMGSGKLSILQGGSLNVFNVIKAIKDEKAVVVRAALFPKRADGKRPSQMRGGTWNIGAKAKNPDAGWKFIQTLSNKEGTLKFNTIGGNGALVRPDIMDDPYFSNPAFKPFVENLLTAMPATVPANGRGTEFEQTINQTWAETFLGKTGFDDGMKKLQDAVQKVLDRPAD
ncbi:MAG: extracellular solute-binding protein [Chloroflexota bacterium]|nr:MAG: extracellular solute-binding protein [Chloroflexota bacterium]